MWISFDEAQDTLKPLFYKIIAKLLGDHSTLFGCDWVSVGGQDEGLHGLYQVDASCPLLASDDSLITRQVHVSENITS